MAFLTKSNYLLGLQCPKLLWVKINDKERIPEPDKLAQQKFDVGKIIGEYAKKVFEDGIDLAELGFKKNIDSTKKKLNKKVPLFEAGFLEEGLFSRADVLSPVGNKWDIIEVKSATKVKEVNIHDVSFQKYVYEKTGLKIRKCFLMHINNECVKDGEIEPKEFFVQTDITEKVEEFSKGIKGRIKNMIKIIESEGEPNCSIGVYCSDPYDCPIKEECWKDVPEESVFEFYRMRKLKCFELYDSGIKKLNEVPDDVKLNDKQKIQRLLAAPNHQVGPEEVGLGEGVPSKEGKNNGKHIDKEQIDFFLKNLKYPIYYLDFETINPAIPKFDGMKPYQRIPFQFSLHVQESKDSELKHISFLAEGTSNPRSKFLQALKDSLGDKGDILVYNQGFEKGVMRECSDAFQEFKEWYEKNIQLRIKDLWDVFRNFWYYDSKQKGSASIKYVLPVMSDLSYNEMDIKNGALASYEYERITYDEDVDDEERKKIRDALEKYCELDTLAEVKIVKKLYEL
ncbi:DUF2779 domain-containing protein [Candidatus Pacearchaeota archaeon]|nr:DUF2779 domain-containing protein [Candidatus Pacearchaeota archaeon]